MFKENYFEIWSQICGEMAYVSPKVYLETKAKKTKKKMKKKMKAFKSFGGFWGQKQFF